jgi:hypothetical protein
MIDKHTSLRPNQLQFFPVCDSPSWEEIESLGFSRKERSWPVPSSFCHTKKSGEWVMAIYNKQYRKPKRGEWYLSGAIVSAYKAPNDLSSKYYIAKLVRVRHMERVVLARDDAMTYEKGGGDE